MTRSGITRLERDYFNLASANTNLVALLRILCEDGRERKFINMKWREINLLPRSQAQIIEGRRLYGKEWKPKRRILKYELLADIIKGEAKPVLHLIFRLKSGRFAKIISTFEERPNGRNKRTGRAKKRAKRALVA